jgi:hypothetical protein
MALLGEKFLKKNLGLNRIQVKSRATTAIQSVWRGHKARLQFKKQVEEAAILCGSSTILRGRSSGCGLVAHVELGRRWVSLEGEGSLYTTASQLHLLRFPID